MINPGDEVFSCCGSQLHFLFLLCQFFQPHWSPLKHTGQRTVKKNRKREKWSHCPMQKKAQVTSLDGKTIRGKVLEEEMSSLLTALWGIASGQNFKNKDCRDLSPALHGPQHGRVGKKIKLYWVRHKNTSHCSRDAVFPLIFLWLWLKRTGKLCSIWPRERFENRESSEKSNKIIKGLEGFTYEED